MYSGDAANTTSHLAARSNINAGWHTTTAYTAASCACGAGAFPSALRAALKQHDHQTLVLKKNMAAASILARHLLLSMDVSGTKRLDAIATCS